MLTLGAHASLVNFSPNSPGVQQMYTLPGTMICINNGWNCTGHNFALCFLIAFTQRRSAHIHTRAFKHVNSVSLQSLRSLRNLSMSSEMDSAWRYAAYHLVEFSQSLISLSCALSLGLCLLFPCIHTGWAVRLKTPQQWYYRSPWCLLRTCRSLIDTPWALWEMFWFTFYLQVIPAVAVTFPIILSRWGAKDLKILKTTW